jgi:unspecific monooxygenase
VFVLLRAVHRDPEAWGDKATEFDPARFLESGAVSSEMYKPFGTGPRACIGRAFALHEATLVLSSIVRKFDVEVLSGDLNVEENLTLRPAGLELRFSAR